MKSWVTVFLTICLLTGFQPAQAAPGALNCTSHAVGFIAPAITAILGSNPYAVDYAPTCTPATLPALAVNLTNPNVPGNHAPYAALNASICQYSPSLDAQLYSTLLTNNTIMTDPIGVGSCGALHAGSYPGTLISAVTSTNSGDGGSSWGVEFVLSASYKGLDTTEDSWDSAAMAGFFLAMSNQHPTWNWFDIKGAFRQTAANWSTGYNSSNFGFGTLNYDGATAIGSTASLYLQGPGMQVTANGFYAAVSLYPFRQTRRSVEALYSVSSSYSWPVKNEYTSTDIAASGATLLYTSNGTDVIPQFNFTPVAAGAVTLIAFTTDGSGHYSRVEPFSEVTVSLPDVGKCTP